jgi:hypothetical protein
MRNIAKICLNSLWGKFGQRRGFTQTDFLGPNEEEKFLKIAKM